MDRKIDILWTGIQMDGQRDWQINKLGSPYKYGGRLPDFAMVRWTDGQTKRQMHLLTDRWMKRQTRVWINGQTERQMDERTNRRTTE